MKSVARKSFGGPTSRTLPLKHSVGTLRHRNTSYEPATSPSSRALNPVRNRRMYIVSTAPGAFTPVWELSQRSRRGVAGRDHSGDHAMPRRVRLDNVRCIPVDYHPRQNSTALTTFCSPPAAQFEQALYRLGGLHVRVWFKRPLRRLDPKSGVTDSVWAEL